MTLLINDRDVLVLEPTVFLDASVAATQLIALGDGVISGSALTSASADFAAANIDEGQVAVLSTRSQACEITQRVATGQITLTLPRADSADPLIAPGDGTALTVKVLSF